MLHSFATFRVNVLKKTVKADDLLREPYRV
jgi:hypothetical protein